MVHDKFYLYFIVVLTVLPLSSTKCELPGIGAFGGPDYWILTPRLAFARYLMKLKMRFM